MAWVLWDILVPLMASFALGILLGWLVWSWQRRKNIEKQTDVPSSHRMVVDAGLADAELSVENNHEALMQASDDSALKEMELANITLIGERDDANLALENLQTEAEEMQARITQLETAAGEELPNSTDTANAALSNLAITADLNAAPFGVNVEPEDSEEFKRMQSDLHTLNETLDNERKARRATELEMLNIKNRHDKLEQDAGLTISADEHTKVLRDRDEEIESLRLQLAYQAEEHEESQLDASQEDELEIPEPMVSESVDQDAEVEPHVAIDQQSIEQEDLLESAVVQAGNQTPLKNGYVPTGWTVPQKKPVKKERDSLTDIKGVGPVIEKALHNCGIYYYRQVADLDAKGMEELQLQFPQFPGRIERDEWVEQAKKLQQEKYGEPA